jgi:hypothetical protein
VGGRLVAGVVLQLVEVPQRLRKLMVSLAWPEVDGRRPTLSEPVEEDGGSGNSVA